MRTVLAGITAILTNLFLASVFAFAAPSLVSVKSSELPQLQPAGSLLAYRAGLEREIAACKRTAKKSSQTIVFGNRVLKKRDWCVNAGALMLKFAMESFSFDEFYEKTKHGMLWYKSVGKTGQGDVGFTGYYFPTLTGSRTPDAVNTYPIYKRPPDLVQGTDRKWSQKLPHGKFGPYPDRHAIDGDGVLKNKGLEIAYVSDVFGAFILQVQGAGAIKFADGSSINVNYAAQNGRGYKAIRKVLMERGIDEKYYTIPGMRKYFEEHPDAMMPILYENPSYVFFQETKDGALGATTTPLVPGHSIAIDSSVMPLSGMALIRTEKPVFENGEVKSWESFASFAIAHDVGGAIRGPGRVDVYWGEDAYAEAAGGTMNQTGELYFAVAP